MNLTPQDSAWIDEYRRQLTQRYPGLVKQVLVYGSKARGEAGPDSDAGILLVVSDEGCDWVRETRRVGYRLDRLCQVAPSIPAHSESEWERRKESRSPLRSASASCGRCHRKGRRSRG